MLKKIEFNNIVTLVIIYFFLMLFRVIYFYFQPENILIQVIPDDAFYYLKIAQQKTIHGFWTFDGTSLTSGFHLLYAYFLYFISLNFDLNWKIVYLIISVLSTFSICFSAFLISKVTYKLYGNKVAIFSIIPFFSYPVFMQSTSMMESFFVILFSSLTIYCVCFFKNNFKNILLFLIIGFLGSLSRTDFGLLPGVLFVLAFLMFLFKYIEKDKVFSTLFILSGAIIGLTFVSTHNYILTDQIGQGSAMVKFYWSSLNGHDIFKPLIYLILPIITPSTVNWIRVLFLIVFVSFCVYSLFIFYKNFSNKKLISNYYLPISSFIIILGYIFFYRFNSSALQFWYVGNLVVPFCLLYAMIFHLILKKSKKIVLYAFLFANIFFLISNTLKYSYPQQELILRMSDKINEKNIEGDIGAWNSGIMGYFTNATIVNLDGLVNNDIFPYIKNNNLFTYIRERKIDHIVDFDFVLNTQGNRVSGGFDDPRMDNDFDEVFSLNDSLIKRKEYKKITLLKFKKSKY